MCLLSIIISENDKFQVQSNFQKFLSAGLRGVNKPANIKVIQPAQQESPKDYEQNNRKDRLIKKKDVREPIKLTKEAIIEYILKSYKSLSYISFSDLEILENNPKETYFCKHADAILDVGITKNKPEGNILGKGSFGEVYSLKKQPDLAAKYLNFAHRAGDIIREIYFLEQFKNHPNHLGFQSCVFENPGENPLRPSTTTQVIIVTKRLSGSAFDFFFDEHKNDSDRCLGNNPYQFFIDVAKGLKAMHDKNIMHRDIKPENILYDKNCLGVIGDLGLATMDNGKVSKLTGTPYFIAPEMLTGNPYNKKVDIFALGVTFTQLLTKEPVQEFVDFNFKKHTKFGGVRSVVDIEKYHLSKVLGNMLKKMTDQNPAKRGSIDEILKILGILKMQADYKIIKEKKEGNKVQLLINDVLKIDSDNKFGALGKLI